MISLKPDYRYYPNRYSQGSLYETLLLLTIISSCTPASLLLRYAELQTNQPCTIGGCLREKTRDQHLMPRRLDDEYEVHRITALFHYPSIT